MPDYYNIKIKQKERVLRESEEKLLQGVKMNQNNRKNYRL